MPEPKAQLVDPQGPIDVPGMQVTGVTTATGGFVGQVQGTATGFAATTYNLNVGVVTATKFQGNTTGNVSGLADDTNINVGIITSTSFTGDLVGNAAGLSTTTANINAGIMSATSFAGNFTGVASGITGTPNIVVGIMTGTLNGDGSSLTGIAATNWITNNVTANSSTTTVDLSLGNVVKFAQSADTTVSFANTGTSNIVTFIRTRTEYTGSFSSGGVEFDGDGDYLTVAGPGDLGTSTDFTMECWVYLNNDATGTHKRIFSANEGSNSDEATMIRIAGGKWQVYIGSNTSSDYWFWQGGTASVGQWYHLALVRNGTTNAFYVNGVSQSSATGSHDVTITTLVVGWGYGTEYLDGKVSNARFTQGQALYTSNFTPPSSELTTTSQGATGSNVKLLCCQSTSSTTAATVTPSGSITANGDPVAQSETIQLTTETALTWPSSIKWDGGSAPTLDTDNQSGSDVNVINLLTRDEGVTWYGWETIAKDTSHSLYELWMWGYNLLGGVAQNNRTGYSSPVQIPGIWQSLHQSTDSAYATFGSKDYGSLWGWGQNNGTLGQNNETQYSSPVQIPGTTWINSSTSEWKTVAVKNDGTLWAWGSGGDGGLGNNQTATSYSSPIQIPGTTWGSEVSGSTGISFNIKTDGTLWGWGSNAYGQLAQNNLTNRSSPVQIPGSWSKISGTGRHSSAIKTDGTLWVWGRNRGGVLGLNQAVDNVRYSSPVQVGSGTDWKSIHIVEARALATKTDGTLWGWGNNEEGQLGQNSAGDDRSSPTQIPGTTWDMVDCGQSGSLTIATKTDGTLWAWGRNGWGGLGQNNNTDYSSPVQVGSGTNWTHPYADTYNAGALKSI